MISDNTTFFTIMKSQVMGLYKTVDEHDMVQKTDKPLVV